MKQTLPEQLRLAADIVEKDLVFEACGKGETKWIEPTRPYHSGNYPQVYIHLGYEIRLAPLTFPDPPEGREWLNGQELTPEEVGLPEWRLMLKGESRHDGYEDYALNRWTRGVRADGLERAPLNEEYTYRTRAPLPIPTPGRIPLTAADVPPGSVVRQKGHATGKVVVEWNTGWITCGTNHGWTYESLKECAEINSSLPLTGKWDSKAWQPCSKPAE